MLSAPAARYALLALMALSPFTSPALRADADDDLLTEVAAAEKWIAEAYPTPLARDAATAKLKRLLEAGKTPEERLAAVRTWRTEKTAKATTTQAAAKTRAAWDALLAVDRRADATTDVESRLKLTLNLLGTIPVDGVDPALVRHIDAEIRTTKDCFALDATKRAVAGKIAEATGRLNEVQAGLASSRRSLDSGMARHAYGSGRMSDADAANALGLLMQAGAARQAEDALAAERAVVAEKRREIETAVAATEAEVKSALLANLFARVELAETLTKKYNEPFVDPRAEAAKELKIQLVEEAKRRAIEERQAAIRNAEKERQQTIRRAEEERKEAKRIAEQESIRAKKQAKRDKIESHRNEIMQLSSKSRLKISKDIMQHENRPTLGAAYKISIIELEMQWIEPNSFEMIAEAGNVLAKDGRATLPKGYWISTKPINYNQWNALMGTPSRRGHWDDGTVKLSEAIQFCNILTTIEKEEGRIPDGYEYRLPSEAQWEYACWAGERISYEIDQECIADANRERDTIGARETLYNDDITRANKWGIYNMPFNNAWCINNWDENIINGKIQSDSKDLGIARGKYYLTGGFNSGNNSLRLILCQMSDQRIEETKRKTKEATMRFTEAERQEAKRQSNAHAYLANVPELAKQATAKIAADIQLNGAKPVIGAAFELSKLQAPMQWIEPGTFTMGTPDNTYREVPMTVTLTKGYWLGTTEVTQAQWRAVMGTSPAEFKGDNLPVEQVSWDDAMDFCKKLTERERAAGRLPAGYAYTLPSEAQWEYACRAGTITRKPNAEMSEYAYRAWRIGAYAGDLDEMAWYDKNSSTTHPVATKQANAWGLYDMHGNVWELCLGWYNPESDERQHVTRGGDYTSVAAECRSASRHDESRSSGGFSRSKSIGFRLALSSVSPAE